MAPGHEVYSDIVRAVKSGKLTEPFNKGDFERACPGHGRGTYNAFLWKHSVGNGSTSELFRLEAPGKSRCVRPFLSTSS